jgi:2-polyprenyl-6-methoxyphenol hydroxylase-like FAD-dependent oxidoreductase
MRILVVGAGPAGLYFSYLAKGRHPDWQIRVVEQNRADSTFGFGVVFSDRALEFLRGDDATTYELITPQMEAWSDITVVHRGTPVVIDGIGFAAIGRLKLLQLLQRQLASVGVVPEYEKAISEEDQGYDLVVAADGVNSTVRGWRDFGTTVSRLENKFAWYGTTKVFDTLTQTFVENEHGTFNAHHYRHSSKMSTFVVECDPQTGARAGFAAMDEAQTLRYCERAFEATLAGHRLVSNRSLWRNFPNLRNQRWSVGNTVLIGDALRTAHFSIGSGTRLAMEDAIALNKALAQESSIPKALAAFEAARRPIVDKLLAAADASGAWYERFPEHMKLAPRDFAWSYIQRSGRVDPARLRKISPKFVDGN